VLDARQTEQSNVDAIMGVGTFEFVVASHTSPRRISETGHDDVLEEGERVIAFSSRPSDLIGTVPELVGTDMRLLPSIEDEGFSIIRESHTAIRQPFGMSHEKVGHGGVMGLYRIVDSKRLDMREELVFVGSGLSVKKVDRITDLAMTVEEGSADSLESLIVSGNLSS
jgi:hypothetical protein